MELELKNQSMPPKEDSEIPTGKMFLSQVTRLTALRRMPDLVFEVMAPFEAAEGKFQHKLLFASAVRCFQCFSHLI